MRQSAEVANQLMSVERVLEYTLLPSEKQPLVPKQPQNDWPRHGKLVFDKMAMRYAEDAVPVLKNLNVTIQPREKVVSLIVVFPFTPLIRECFFTLGWSSGSNWSRKVVADISAFPPGRG